VAEAPPTSTDAQVSANDPGADRTVQSWIDKIERAEKDEKRHEWTTRCKKVRNRYMDERTENQGRDAKKFALLWANQETLKPVVYARCPRPEVNRRFKDEDPVGRVSSEVLERALSYTVDAQDFDAVMKLCRDDFLLYARGTAWVRYVPHMKQAQTPVTPMAPAQPEPGADGDTTSEGPSVSEDADAYIDATGRQHDAADVKHDDEIGPHIVEDVLDYEEVIADHVHYDDFIHPVIRTWSELPWAARRVYMTREELIDRFGEEIGNAVPLDWRQDQTAGNHTTTHGEQNADDKAVIYELWDRRTKQALWINKGYPGEFLDQRDDPLELVDFWPFPRPIQGTTTSNSVIPVPDYVFYQDQAEEIDMLTAKIGRLEKGLKMMGFYAGSTGLDLAELFSEGENRLVPISDWATLKGDGGVRGLIEWWPLDQVVSTLDAMVKLRAQIIQDVFQITGIADILRGASDADETATAQGIKANWGAVRVRDKQKELARFARDLIRLMGQVIGSRFSVNTLKQVTDLKMFDSPEQKQQAQQQIAMQQAAARPPMPAQGPQGPQAAPGGQAPVQPPQGAPGQSTVPPGAPPHPMQPGQPPQPGSPPGAPQAAPQPPAPPSPPPVPFQVQRQLSNPTWAEVMQLLQDQASRQFRIDVETDSTIEPDEQAAKAAATEFIEALGHYISSALPAVQAAPQMMPLIGETMKYLVRHYRAGRELEDIIDRIADSIANQPPPQPQQPGEGKGPDPAAMVAAQARMIVAQTGAHKAQADIAEGQAHLRLDAGKLALDQWSAQHDPRREFIDIGGRP
jgi:hypothetical protein